MAKYMFSGIGNFTVVVAKSYTDVVRNSLGDPITTKKIPAKRAPFDNGYFETDDADIAQLLVEHKSFGTEFYWNAAMEGKEPKFSKSKSKPIEDSKKAMAKAKAKARKTRLETGMRKEDE